MTPPLLVQDDNGIVTITLNRPEARNALNRALLESLRSVLAGISCRRGVRAVILTGAGDKAFCAGADLRERLGMGEEEVRAFLPLIRGAITDVERVPCPVIGAINGVAFGGGMELLLACDLRVASSGAVLGLTEVSLGIIPGAGGTQRLPRIVGLAKAKELILTARRVDAEAALRMGLVNQVAAPDAVMQVAREWAAEVARNAPVAVAQAKTAMDMGFGLPIDAGLHLEWKCYEQTLHTRDRVEGLKAFSEKRAPLYEGA